MAYKLSSQTGTLRLGDALKIGVKFGFKMVCLSHAMRYRWPSLTTSITAKTSPLTPAAHSTLDSLLISARRSAHFRLWSLSPSFSTWPTKARQRTTTDVIHMQTDCGTFSNSKTILITLRFRLWVSYWRTYSFATAYHDDLQPNALYWVQQNVSVPSPWIH